MGPTLGTRKTIVPARFFDSGGGPIIAGAGAAIAGVPIAAGTVAATADATAESTARCRSAAEIPGCAASWSEIILLTSAAEIPGWAAPSTILETSASDRPSGIWIPAIADCNSSEVTPEAGAGKSATADATAESTARCRSAAEMPGCAASWSEIILLTSAAEIPGWAAPSTILETSASDRPSGIWMPAIAACNSSAVIPAGAGAGAGSSPAHATASTITSTSGNIRASSLPNFMSSSSVVCVFQNGWMRYQTTPVSPTCR